MQNATEFQTASEKHVQLFVFENKTKESASSVESYQILLSRRTSNAETVRIREHNARVRADLAKSGMEVVLDGIGIAKDFKQKTKKGRGMVEVTDTAN